MLFNLFIFHAPSDSEFGEWLSDSLKQSGYSIVRSLEDSQVVLFVITSAALNSPWLNHFKQQIHQKRERGELEVSLGALLRDDIHYSAGGESQGDYDFVVDFRRSDRAAALEELRRRIEGQPENWGIEELPVKSEVVASDAGMAKVHLRFPLDAFATWMERARTHIKIMATWTSLVEYREALLAAVGRGAHVQFLLLKPDSPIAELRSQDIFHFGAGSATTDENEVSAFVRESVRRFNDLYAEAEGLNGTFELRLYETMPSIPVYISDDQVLIGFYPHSVRSTSFPHLEIGLESPFGEQMLNEFERIWVNAIPHRLPIAPEAAKEANEKLSEPLTATELRVLNLVCKGMSNQEIADELVVQYSTVRAHKNHIYSKLGISSNPTLLVIRAQELGLTTSS